MLVLPTQITLQGNIAAIIDWHSRAVMNYKLQKNPILIRVADPDPDSFGLVDSDPDSGGQK